MKDNQSITSRTNPKVKELLELKESKDYFFVEGYRIIDEILNADFHPQELIFTPKAESNPITPKAKSMSSNYTALSEQVFTKLSDTKEPQGLAAFFKKQSYEIKDLLKKSGKNRLFLLLHEIQDPGNLGTIFRTARASGVSGILLTNRSVSVTNTKVVRASMGSVFTVPFVDNIDLNNAISYLKNSHISIAATDANLGKDLFKTDYTLPICFVFGSEAHGLPDDVFKKADFVLKIPMINKIESLNLSVSAAILMYDAVQKYKWIIKMYHWSKEARLITITLS